LSYTKLLPYAEPDVANFQPGDMDDVTFTLSSTAENDELQDGGAGVVVVDGSRLRVDVEIALVVDDAAVDAAVDATVDATVDVEAAVVNVWVDTVDDVTTCTPPVVCVVCVANGVEPMLVDATVDADGFVVEVDPAITRVEVEIVVVIMAVLVTGTLVVVWPLSRMLGALAAFDLPLPANTAPTTAPAMAAKSKTAAKTNMRCRCFRRCASGFSCFCFSAGGCSGFLAAKIGAEYVADE
jgi:hypothetical protein